MTVNGLVCSIDTANRNHLFPSDPSTPPCLGLLSLWFAWLETTTTKQAALSEARSKLAALENALSRSDEELQEAKSQLERMQVCTTKGATAAYLHVVRFVGIIG